MALVGEFMGCQDVAQKSRSRNRSWCHHGSSSGRLIFSRLSKKRKPPLKPRLKSFSAIQGGDNDIWERKTVRVVTLNFGVPVIHFKLWICWRITHSFQGKPLDLANPDGITVCINLIAFIMITMTKTTILIPRSILMNQKRAPNALAKYLKGPVHFGVNQWIHVNPLESCHPAVPSLGDECSNEKTNGSPVLRKAPVVFPSNLEKLNYLVVFHQPIWKNMRKSNWIISPQVIRGENKQILKPSHLGIQYLWVPFIFKTSWLALKGLCLPGNSELQKGHHKKTFRSCKL